MLLVEQSGKLFITAWHRLMRNQLADQLLDTLFCRKKTIEWNDLAGGKLGILSIGCAADCGDVDTNLLSNSSLRQWAEMQRTVIQEIALIVHQKDSHFTKQQVTPLEMAHK